MPVEVSMPQLGESIAEGTLIKWHKKVGEKIQRDEPLFEISTDKVDTEVPAPEAGYLEKILVSEGETVPVHTIVCRISDSPPEEKEGQAETGTDRGVKTATPEKEKAASAASPASRSTPSDPPMSVGTEEKLSPLVRRLAAENDLDLTGVRGSGAAGRITKADVRRLINERKAAGLEKAPPDDRHEPVPGDGDRIEPMSVMRQRISDHMLLSRRTSAHVTTIFEVDMTPLRELKRSLGPRFEERHRARLTYLPFITRAVCKSLKKHPELNASIEGRNVHFHGVVNIGVAVALDGGLIVPVIREADRKTLVELALAVNDVARRARSKELHPEEVQGGTFTITNPGVFGSLIGTPIINQPQVAILCIGAIQKRPVVLPENDAIAVRSMAYFSLTFDHRLIDGAMADRFLAHVKGTLEHADFEGLSGMKHFV